MNEEIKHNLVIWIISIMIGIILASIFYFLLDEIIFAIIIFCVFFMVSLFPFCNMIHNLFKKVED
jgi:hypothetical protein